MSEQTVSSVDFLLPPIYTIVLNLLVYIQPQEYINTAKPCNAYICQAALAGTKIICQCRAETMIDL